MCQHVRSVMKTPLRVRVRVWCFWLILLSYCRRRWSDQATSMFLVRGCGCTCVCVPVVIVPFAFFRFVIIVLMFELSSNSFVLLDAKELGIFYQQRSYHQRFCCICYCCSSSVTLHCLCCGMLLQAAQTARSCFHSIRGTVAVICHAPPPPFACVPGSLRRAVTHTTPAPPLMMPDSQHVYIVPQNHVVWCAVRPL